MGPVLEPGAKVAGRYVIERLIGRGGMGAVYEARHEELGRTVALKVLLPELARETEVVARFFREARTAAALHHPGIVEVFDLGRDGDLAFIVMERLEGEELAERITHGGKLGPRFVTTVGVEIAEAISAAHELGVVHRDLKPQNVFLAARGRDQEEVKILDFGIAKLADSEAAEAQLTRTGEIFGTPLYMPPEQLHGRKDIDARADVYAIGVILYEALSGQPPFRADSYPSLVLKIVEGKPPPLKELRPDLPETLVAVIARAMSADREERFPSANALAVALYDIAQTLPPDPVAPEPAEEQAAGAVVDGLERTAQRMTPSKGRQLASFSRPVTPSSHGALPFRATPSPVTTYGSARGRVAWTLAVVVAAAAGTLVVLFLLPVHRPRPPPEGNVEALAVPQPALLPDAAVPAATPSPRVEEIVALVPAERPDAGAAKAEQKPNTRRPGVPVKKSVPDDKPPALLPR